MQYKNQKYLQYLQTLGKIIKKKRLEKGNQSRYHFCISYGLDSSNLRRIENGEIEPKITMLIRIAEAFNIPLSDILKEVETELGKDFYITEQ